MQLLSNIIYAPIMIPLITAIIIIGFWKNHNVQRWLFLLGSILYLCSAFTLFAMVNKHEYVYSQVGNWTAPIGITLIADYFSALMVLITSILTFVTFLYSKDSIDPERLNSGFYPMMMFMIVGVTGSFLTGDVFNLYVWFEVMLMASFVLITLGGSRKQLEGGIKYVAINFFASAIFLAGIGILYGLTGTLNMADLAVRLPMVENKELIHLASVFFFICFGIKAALFPLYFWLPASYHTPPVGIISIIAGLLTKVGVYSFIRFYTLLFSLKSSFNYNLLLYAAICSMFFGVLGAIVQNDFRKILSFHIISQIGYMILGLALNSTMALTGSIFYIIHHILVKTNLFLMSGISGKITNSFDIREMGDIYKKFPIISILFACSAFALVGIPPLSGFWGKLMIAQAGLINHEVLAVVVLLLVSVFTLFSMTKIWTEAFLKKSPSTLNYSYEPKLINKHPLLLSGPLLMTLLILFISLFPNILYEFSEKASKQLRNPSGYIETVINHYKR